MVDRRQSSCLPDDRGAFLRRVVAMAHATPCVLPRADLLRLLTLARLDDTHVFKLITDATDVALATDRSGVLAAVILARRNPNRLP